VCFSVISNVGVCEGRKEARQTAKNNKNGGEVLVDGFAVAIVGQGRAEELVQVGRSLMRLPTPDNVFSWMVFWELPLDLEEELAAPMGSINPLDLEEELAAPMGSIVFGGILASDHN
jgi:hypothetical protein